MIEINNDKLDLVLRQNEEFKNEIEKLKANDFELRKEINNLTQKPNEIKKIHKTIKKLEKTIPTNTNLSINNQFLEKLIQKDKKIEELIKKSNNKIILNDDDLDNPIKLKANDKFEELEQLVNLEEIEEKPMTLILNNDIIECRKSDGYINATQLCKAGGKKRIIQIS